MHRWMRRSSPGFTFIELIVTTAVLMVLASALLPIARISIRRQREADLRRTLREVRTAIDRFKTDYDQGRIGGTAIASGSEGYPASLQQLVDGVPVMNDPTGRKIRYLLDSVYGFSTHSDPSGFCRRVKLPETTPCSIVAVLFSSVHPSSPLYPSSVKIVSNAGSLPKSQLPSSETSPLSGRSSTESNSDDGSIVT